MSSRASRSTPGARIRKGAGALVAGLALASVVASGASCSATHDPAGGLLLAVDTNLRVPDDIDTIGIAVSGANDGGVTEDDMFPLAPDGTAKFPATLAIIRGTDKPIQIRAVGYKDGQAIAMHEAVTTLPADRVALLPFELNWLDKPLVSGTTAGSVLSVTTSCGSSEGPLAGTCASFQLDSASLSTYAASSVNPSDGTAAVDVTTCFAGAQPVTVAAAACTFPPPAGVTDATQLNVALVPSAGHAAGWCAGAACVVPLPADPTQGWSLGSDGLVHLPPAACTSAAVEAVVVVPATAACPVLSSSHPAQQIYGGDGGVVSSADSGDATLPGDGGPDGEAGSSEAGPNEAGPPADVTSVPLAGIVSLTADSTTLYVLERTTDGGTATVLTALPIDFSAATAGPPTDCNAPAPPAGQTLSSAAGLGFYSVNGLAMPGVRTNLKVYEMDDLTYAYGTAYDAGVELSDMDIAAGSNPGEAFASYVGPNGGQALHLFLYPDGGLDFFNLTLADQLPLVTASAHFDPSDGGAAFYAFGSTNDEVTLQPYFDDGGSKSAGFSSGVPYALAYAGGALQALNQDGSVSQVGPTAGSVIATGALVAPHALAGNANLLVWINAADGRLLYALPTLGVFRQQGALSLAPDGGAVAAVSQVIFAGDQLVWFDAQGLHRVPASTLPSATR